MTPKHGENLLKKQTNTKIFYCNLESKNLSMHWRHHLTNSRQITSVQSDLCDTTIYQTKYRRQWLAISDQNTYHSHYFYYMSTLLLSIWPLGYLVFHQNASKKIPSKHLQFEETTYKIKQIFGIQLQMITVQSHELLPLHITLTKNNQSVQKGWRYSNYTRSFFFHWKI